jgi:hypothetical protein
VPTPLKKVQADPFHFQVVPSDLNVSFTAGDAGKIVAKLYHLSHYSIT